MNDPLIQLIGKDGAQLYRRLSTRGEHQGLNSLHGILYLNVSLGSSSFQQLAKGVHEIPSFTILFILLLLLFKNYSALSFPTHTKM